MTNLSRAVGVRCKGWGKRLAVSGSGLIVVLLLCTSCVNTDHSRHSIAPKIIGGSDAPADRYYFMATVRVKFESGERPHCGATLIAPQYVLTAAHCMGPGIAESAMVYFNVLKQSDLSKSYSRRIADVFIPEGWSDNGMDIAVLKLDRPVTGLQPIARAGVGDDRYQRPGNWVRVIGWGLTQTLEPPYEGADRLQQVEVLMASEQDCKRLYPGQSEGKSLCAGRVGLSTCGGDSGGPLFIQQADTQQFVQTGVVSQGYGAHCEDKEMSLYVRLNNPEVARFIDQSMRQ